MRSLLFLLLCLQSSLIFTQSLIKTLVDMHQLQAFKPIITPQCKKFYEAIGNKDDRDPQIKFDKQVFSQKSGHSLFDLGSYQSCISNASYNFFVMQVELHPQNVSSYVGLCSPHYCNATDWSNETAWLQETIPRVGGPNLSNLSFIVIDPLNLDIKVNIGTFFAVMVTGVFVIIAVTSTFCFQFFDRKVGRSIQNEESQYNNPDNASQLSGTKSPALFSNRYPSAAISLKDNSSVGGDIDALRSDREPPRTFFLKLLHSFDMSRNFDEATLKEEKEGDRNLQTLDGIKAFSIIHVIFGNVFLLSIGSKNAPAALYFAQESWWFLFAGGAAYTFDTFFFISGFLAAYKLLPLFKEASYGFLGTLKLFFRVYVQRWFRLWPTYAFLLLFFWKIGPLLAGGPAWFQFVNFSNACENSWWKNLLFLDNILSPAKANQHCMIWTLSVPIEFQMFLILPFVVWVYSKDKEYGKTLIWLLIVFSIAASYSFAIQSNLPFRVQIDPPPNVDDIFNIFVANPMVHWSAYFIGAYVGILYRNYKNGEQNFYTFIFRKRIAGYIISFLGFALLMACLLPLPRTEQKQIVDWPQSVVYFWAACGRPFVALCVWLWLLPCLAGYAKSLRNFFRWGIWRMISNLVYPIYLVHFVVILLIYASDTQFGEFSLHRKIYFTFTAVTCSFFVALILHLLIEKPIILLTRGNKSSQNGRFNLQGLSDSTTFVRV